MGTNPALSENATWFNTFVFEHNYQSSSLFKASIGGLLKRILHHRVLPRKILQHNISNLWLRGCGYFRVQTVNEYGWYEVDARSDPMQSWLFFCHSSASFPPTYKYIHHLDLCLCSWLSTFHSKLITRLLSPAIFALSWLGDTGRASIACLQWAPSAASSVHTLPNAPSTCSGFWEHPLEYNTVL